MAKKRTYKMTVAGQLFKHLGLQMYSGAVPAIAELISNAYDAMARNVWISIPVGRPIKETDEIIVTDDGHGMTYEECNSLYLSVGRDRRPTGEEWTTPYNGLKPRKVQGRKGIGKLAGFGIANRIEIRTIQKGEISHFALDYSELTKSQKFADISGYAPEPFADDGKKTKNKPGTTVTLSLLKVSRTIEKETFKRGLARGYSSWTGISRCMLTVKLCLGTRYLFSFGFRKSPTHGKRQISEMDDRFNGGLDSARPLYQTKNKGDLSFTCGENWPKRHGFLT